MNVNEAIRYLQTSTFDDATEPVFVLRGRDRLAASCILYWIQQAEKFRVNRAKIIEAGNVIERFMTWPTTRLPD